jgi:hypothetical protein
MKGYKIDTKTGEIKLVEDKTPLPISPLYQEPKGIDFEKLKEVLVKKGIIKDKSEIE